MLKGRPTDGPRVPRQRDFVEYRGRSTCARCGKDGQTVAGLTQHQRGAECLKFWLTKHKVEFWTNLKADAWREVQRRIWLVMQASISDEEQLEAIRRLHDGTERAEQARLAMDTIRGGNPSASWPQLNKAMRVFLLSLIKMEDDDG